MWMDIRQRWRDMGTIKTLCGAAEAHARAEGSEQPGAEHFVLAAFDLPDESARRALRRVQLAPEDFRAGVKQQYRDALQRVVGLESPEIEAPPPVPGTGRGLYRAQPSGQDLMQVLTREIMVPAQRAHARAPLLGAHVLLAALAAQHGVTARALRAMGVEATRLKIAVEAEIAASLATGQH